MSGEIELSWPAPHVARIVLCNPPVNALGDAARRSLGEALDEIERDKGARALIIAGCGENFCAGDDLREAAGRGENASASLGRFGELLERIERLSQPVIAEINGPAIGGGLELALCCDIRIASETAIFVAAGVRVGLVASTFRLPRLIGEGPAKAMLLTGERTDARQALRYGLVTEVHPGTALSEAALAIATQIASRAPLAVAAAKRLVREAPLLSPDESRQAATDELDYLVATEDHWAAVSAFLAGHRPVFHGR